MGLEGDHLIEGSGADQCPAGRKAERLAQKDGNRAAGAGELCEGGVALFGLLGDAAEGTDVGRIAAGMIVAEGQRRLIRGERAPDRVVEVARELRVEVLLAGHGRSMTVLCGKMRSGQAATWRCATTGIFPW